MKTLPAKQKATRIDSRTAKILRALREARKTAVKSARMHGVPIIYLKNGKLVRERA
jgi:hypothetical protein